MQLFKKLITVFIFLVTVLAISQTSPGEYTIQGVGINTKLSDFGTAFFGKKKVIFAAPKDNAVIARVTWGGNNQPFLDLYIGDIGENGEITNKKRILGDVNTKYHEGVVSFTKDKKTVYFSANDYLKKKYRTDSTGTNNIQLFKAAVTPKGEWVNIVKLPFNNTQFSTGHPALNVDDTKLYFISDRPESIGKTDIYVVDIHKDGTYSKPKNLGEKINTEQREMFPFISDDNILYYSSNGKPGFGNLDIFASKIFDNTVAEPINLEKPINSKKDDFAYIIDDTNHKGYFSSNRKGGKGDDDIYRFSSSPPIHFECNQLITGVIKDKETQKLISGATVVLNDEKGNKINEAVVKEDASFSFEVPCNTSFTLVGTAPGFLQEELPVKTVNDLDSEDLEANLELAPELKVVDEKIMININTIYFDFDKWNIRPDAAKELDKVIAVMKDHPSMIIEAGSHTDSRAREAYNQILSEKRAKATVDYIVLKGIDRNRIKAKGYGEMQLVNNCSSFVKCTREQHQLNRRTEFVIINDNNRFASNAASLDDVAIGSNNMTYVKTDAIDVNVSVTEKTKDAVKAVISNAQNNATTGSSKYVKIAPIYFDYDKWSLSDKELKQLDAVVKIMKENPAIVVEAGAHTDSRNLESYNKILSDKRAKTVVNYIISKGVAPNRITGKGYGESRYVNKCRSFVPCSEKEHQANRRIEFMIVDGNKYPIEDFIEKNSDSFINTNPIYFDYDKFDIRKDAAYELDRVIRILKENPDLNIEAGSHTDANNTEAYNQTLSDKRAKSVKGYLVSNGILKNRIVSKGYGEKQLINKCSSFVKCTPEQHQQNRRTEFKIIKNQ